MNSTRTFAFAALAALSLGIGTAMAQDGPSSPATDWQSEQILGTGRTATPNVYRGAARAQIWAPQSGSSDRLSPVQDAGTVGGDD
jgi:hypothetical protein